MVIANLAQRNRARYVRPAKETGEMLAALLTSEKSLVKTYTMSDRWESS